MIWSVLVENTAIEDGVRLKAQELAFTANITDDLEDKRSSGFVSMHSQK